MGKGIKTGRAQKPGTKFIAIFLLQETNHCDYKSTQHTCMV